MCCFGLVCFGPRVALLVVDLSSSESLLLWFGFPRSSSRSAYCRLVFVSIFVGLVCLGPRVALHVVDLTLSQSLLVWFSIFVAPGEGISLPAICLQSLYSLTNILFGFNRAPKAVFKKI